MLRREANPRYDRLLREYERLTGLPYILNTSFNLHEQPIVCTPAEALQAFCQAGLDMMSMGPYLVERQD